MKRPTLISLSLLAVISFSAALVSTTMSTNFIFSKADEKTTTITLNASNKPTINGDSGLLEYNEFATFTYTRASEYEGGHVILESGGTLEKVQESNDLKSITVSFAGSLQIECDWEKPFSDEHIVGNLVTGEPFSIVGNYWKITALDITSIDSISLTFGCEEASVAPDTTTSAITGIANENNFARIFEKDGDVYFSVKGIYNISAGRLTSKDITLVGDDEEQIIQCEYIDLLSTTTFIAYFNLTDWYGANTNGVEVFCHLYVRGVHAFGNGGDVAVKSRTFETKSLDIDGARNVALVDYSWSVTGATMHMAKLVFKYDLFRLDTTTSLARLIEENGKPYYVVRLLGDVTVDYDTSSFVLFDSKPNEVETRYPISIAAEKYEEVDDSHIDVYFDLTQNSTYVLYDSKDIGTFMTPHIKYNGSEIGDVVGNDSYDDSTTKVWINSIYNSTADRYYSLFIRNQIFSLSLTKANIVLDDTDMLAKFDVVDGNINYVLNMHVNDKAEFDYTKLTLVDGSRSLPYVKHVDDDYGNTSVYFNMSSLSSGVEDTTVSFNSHLYYDGSAYYSTTGGNVMNMHKGMDFKQTSGYETIPSAHSSTPMYLTGEGQSVTNGTIHAQIVYRWSIFSFLLWKDGSVSPTVSATSSQTDFFNLFFQNRTQKTGAVLYIKFTISGNIKPDTLGVGDSTSFDIAGFFITGTTVEISFDITRLNGYNQKEYCHLFRNGSKITFNEKSGGDILTGYKKSSKATLVSYGLNALRCSSNGIWYELKEAYNMIVVTTGSN